MSADQKTAAPYLWVTRMEKVWNPEYPQEAKCQCGHAYYRHFDSYDHMANVGCKYCDCTEFQCSESASVQEVTGGTK